MKNKQAAILKKKIIEGMKISSQKLIARKKLLGQKVVVSENGVIREIEPEDLK
ncbi:MAG: hypothetical protein MI921_29300 [Cytophagales bacterium]|nr:hypothetical protein [Cytophagales bacterium]